MRTISFMSANYVGRALKYQGPADWGPNNDAVLASINAECFMEIAQDVAGAGFEAIDIWTAHCHWAAHASEDYLEQVKGFCSQFDLAITSYAGGFDAKTPADVEAPLRFMKQLGAPMFAGGIGGGLPPAELAPMVNSACEKFGVKWAFENHPEKSVEDIIAKIDGGKHDRVGIALDTGWCATQGVDALEAVKRIHQMGKLFILHLKDVEAAGAHDNCAIGEGIAPCEAVVKYLVKSGWDGDICVEHEPYDRDPMPEVLRGLARVREWMK